MFNITPHEFAKCLNINYNNYTHYFMSFIIHIVTIYRHYLAQIVSQLKKNLHLSLFNGYRCIKYYQSLFNRKSIMRAIKIT